MKDGNCFYDFAFFFTEDRIDKIWNDSEKGTRIQLFDVSFEAGNQPFQKLKFAEKETNLEIKNYLKKSFKTQFLSQKKLLDYKIEDIDMQLSTNLENEQYISYLKDVRKILKENKSLIRLEKSFNSTPIVNADNFSAGKILFGSTIYEKQSKELLSDSKLFILACLFGLMIGLLYVFNAKNTSRYN